MTRSLDALAGDEAIEAIVRKSMESISSLKDQTLYIRDRAGATARSATEYRGAVETVRKITKTAGS